MNRKGFTPILVILIVVVVVLIIGFIWYYGLHKVTLPSTATSTSNSDTHWATYISPLGFSFEYPSAMKYSVSVDGSIAINPFGGTEIDVQEIPLTTYLDKKMFAITTSSIHGMPAIVKSDTSTIYPFSGSIAMENGQRVIKISYLGNNNENDVINQMAQSVVLTPPNLPMITQDALGNQTYINSFYGFSISYPASVIATTTGGYFLQSHAWSQLDAGAVAQSLENGVNVLDLLVDTKNLQNGATYGYYEAQIQIGESQDPLAVKNCISSSNGSSSIVTINGNTFYKYAPLTNAGMSQFSTLTSYRTLHNNTCFSIEPSFNSSPDGIDLSLATEKDQKVINAIINSFTFIR
jgi:hypothetical protein